MGEVEPWKAQISLNYLGIDQDGSELIGAYTYNKIKVLDKNYEAWIEGDLIDLVIAPIILCHQRTRQFLMKRLKH